MFLAAAPEPDSLLSDLTPEQLENELVDLAAQINAATCRWLELAAEFDRHKAYESFGFASCADWLAWRCSLTPRSAREQMRVARDLASLPRVRAEFAAGRLSYSKVRALSRFAEGAIEEELIELAHVSTAAQLERLLRACRRATSEDDEVAAAKRHFSTIWEDVGTLSISGSLPADEGALLLKALELAGDELFASYLADAEADGVASEGGEPPVRPTRADALLALAETTIARGSQVASGGDRHQVVVHVDVSAGRPTGDDKAGPGGSAEPHEVGPPASASPLVINHASVGDAPLSPTATRRLACDASIVTLVEEAGVPLSVGRKTRSIPPAIRRALLARDECCAFPGCEQRRFVDAHHLIHWADGGETALDNLVLLRRRHHRMVHEGGMTIEGEAGSPLFRRANGALIEPAPRLRSADAVRQPGSLARFAPESPPPWGKGERFDLDQAVFVVADQLEKRKARAEVHSQSEAGSGADLPPPMAA